MANRLNLKLCYFHPKVLTKVDKETQRSRGSGGDIQCFRLSRWKALPGEAQACAKPGGLAQCSLRVGWGGGFRSEPGDTQVLKDIYAHKDDLHSGKKLCLHVYLLLR